MRCLEDLAMREDAKSFLGRIGPLARSQLATQAAVLLPVIVVAGLSAWTLRAPPSADSQSARVARRIRVERPGHPYAAQRK